MLPPLDPTTRHLPLGRHSATLDEIEARFVAAPEFAASTTRAAVWEGFERWLAVWGAAADALEVSGLLRNLWLSGSFVSSEVDPDDIDVTPFVDRELYESCRGKTGVGLITNLVGHRAKVAATYHVEPFVVWWRHVPAILLPSTHTPDEREYLSRRGAMDDLWQRVRSEGEKGPLTAETAAARRGYVEVIL